MKKINEKDIYIAVIAAIIFSPFIIIGKIIKNIENSIGVFDETKNDFETTKNQNLKE